ncbi:MAG: hypothetical protein R2792_05265 [Saprospiraceae bacterium]
MKSWILFLSLILTSNSLVAQTPESSIWTDLLVFDSTHTVYTTEPFTLDEHCSLQLGAPADTSLNTGFILLKTDSTTSPSGTILIQSGEKRIRCINRNLSKKQGNDLLHLFYLTESERKNILKQGIQALSYPTENGMQSAPELKIQFDEQTLFFPSPEAISQKKEAKKKAEAREKARKTAELFKSGLYGKGSSERTDLPPTTMGGGLRDRKVVERSILNLYKGNEEGRIVLDVCVDSTGTVVATNYKLVGSTSNNPEMIRSAIESMKNWKFEPSEQETQCGNIIFNFKQK